MLFWVTIIHENYVFLVHKMEGVNEGLGAIKIWNH